ncbi:Hypothetical protein PHPALM_2419 [Phytophthora palmivora]|uniref:DUF659 domain-containing protein n=1 Tax=Phytophthora palmivora TaxID=4796 RepID=A0A2P4YPT2_9STRA|nr:Hypothetical protein PHPALM_2419 [Phytophthora palmivora]
MVGIFNTPRTGATTNQKEVLVASTHLDDSYETEKEKIVSLLKKHPYVSLTSDGWSNPRREKIVNFVLVAPNMPPIFWTSIAPGSQSQTGKYIAQQVGKVIDDVESLIGKGKVASVTTDNAPNMVKAWEILENTRGVFCSGCGAHTLNLLLEDIKVIHSDRRNRLKTEKVRKLVFKYSNSEDNTSIPEVVFDGVTLKRKEGGNNSDDEGEPLAISDENDASSSSSDDEEESDGDRDGDTEANADNYVHTSYDYPYSQE